MQFKPKIFRDFFEIYFSKIFCKKIDFVKILKIAQGPKFYDEHIGFFYLRKNIFSEKKIFFHHLELTKKISGKFPKKSS